MQAVVVGRLTWGVQTGVTFREVWDRGLVVSRR